uniref:Uncharacterized protein n=2 Tax=Kalmanozyma brasiliensis (strain GHG001) TaxID=1365824 RepID=V5EGG2_KALBG
MQQRRLSTGGFPGYQPNLQTIPGSVAASEVASEHHSMHSSALGSRGTQQYPSIAAGSSPPLSHGALAGDSDGYNTYTGAVKGQLRVVGPSGAYGQPTIAEEDPRFSTSSRTGSRMLEMLDAEEQPIVPDSVTGGEPTQPAATPSRPPFWKERSKSAQSITRVFRSSPRQSPATELPPLDLGRSDLAPEAPMTDGDTGMWKEPSRAKSPSALRKWTTKRNSKGPTGAADNEVDVDQLFS